MTNSDWREVEELLEGDADVESGKNLARDYMSRVHVAGVELTEWDGRLCVAGARITPDEADRMARVLVGWAAGAREAAQREEEMK